MRSYSSPSDLVQLPRLTAQSAARLLQQLLNAAKAEKKLPAALVPDRDQLTTVRVVLVTELSKRIAGDGAETPQVRAADIVEDNAFGALIDFLRAWDRLPLDRHPEAAIAKTIIDSVAAKGLGFLAIRPIDEWQEVDLRIGILRQKGFDQAIRTLGGGAFLDELTTAHTQYGEALGITVVKPVVESPAVGAAHEAALEAIREYVLRVSAHVRKSDPQTQALATRLLAPLTNWEDRATGGADEVVDAAEDEAKEPQDDAITDASPVTEPGAEKVAKPASGDAKPVVK